VVVNQRSLFYGPELNRFRIGVAGIVVAVAIGFVGYQVFADASAFDAIFLTVITISTVGYSEIIELGDAGRMVSVAVILTGVISVSVTAIAAAELLFEGHIRRAIEGRRMQRSIESLRDHVIICGFGRVGMRVAQEMADNGAPFVIVDKDPDKVAGMESVHYFHIDGDATEELVLEAAGLDRARAVVAAVNSDADNVLITLTAKGLNPGVEVIARTKADENEGKLRRAGADRVIAPTTIGGRRIGQLLTRPVVADFLDRVAAGGVDILLDEVPVRGGSDLAGKTLRDVGIRQRYGCTVIAVRSGAEMDTHPDPDRRLIGGDVLVVMGDEDAIDRMRSDYT
jgi:voltage-gated potassium channel